MIEIIARKENMLEIIAREFEDDVKLQRCPDNGLPDCHSGQNPACGKCCIDVALKTPEGLPKCESCDSPCEGPRKMLQARGIL